MAKGITNAKVVKHFYEDRYEVEFSWDEEKWRGIVQVMGNDIKNARLLSVESWNSSRKYFLDSDTELVEAINTYLQPIIQSALQEIIKKTHNL